MCFLIVSGQQCRSEEADISTCQWIRSFGIRPAVFVLLPVSLFMFSVFSEWLHVQLFLPLDALRLRLILAVTLCDPGSGGNLYTQLIGRFTRFPPPRAATDRCQTVHIDATLSRDTELRNSIPAHHAR